MISMVSPGLPGSVTCGEDEVSDRGPEGGDAARAGDFSPLERLENRSINRIPVRLAVSHQGRSAPLGRTRDISLHGLFIETREPFDVGAVVPLAIGLDGRAPLLVRAEVVRRTPDGMGLRFRDLSREAGRRLRRWVVDHTSVAASRRQVEQLRDESARIEPIRDPDRIRGLLGDIKAAAAQVTLIPAVRVARDYASLVAVEPDGLAFEVAEASTLVGGEEAFALVTLQFVSYSFSLRLRAVDGRAVRTGLPDLVVFSERRTRERVEAPPGSTIRWPSPWNKHADIVLPLVDLSDDGLSFRAPDNALLTPGSVLEGATVCIDGRTRALEVPEVRNLVRVEDASGVWLRVGVAVGHARLGKQPRSASRVAAKTPIGRFVDRVKTTMSVLIHRGKDRIAGSGADTRRVVVRPGPLPIVGILDRTSDDERISAPLVIVAPGFAGRKEQMSFLAGILVEGFQRQNADIAVLRFDGTNNLGESGKDPQCQGDGLHCMHYTATGLVDDTLAAIAWAKNNPFVDPTDIVLVSSSAGSVGVLKVLTMPEGRDVSLWFAYMGAPDVIDLIKNGTGNIDFHAYFMRGEKVGVMALHGVLMDGDHFWRDLHQSGLGSLDHARALMARVSADVVWLRGKHDALVDPRRVEALMRLPAKGAREIIDVDGGHLPRTGEEAVTQFTRITQRIWKKLHGCDMPTFRPSIGKLAVKAEAEWKQTRRAVITDRAQWWRDYLLRADGGIGFDILEYLPEYVDILELQARRTLTGSSPSRAPLVLELGAGTGNLTRRLIDAGAHVIATDLVADALHHTLAKIGEAASDRFETQVVDIEGSPWLAMKRFLRGDLPSALTLAERIPGVQKGLLASILEREDDDVHAILRGHDIDTDSFMKRARMVAGAAPLLRDLNVFAKAVAGRITPESAKASLGFLPTSILDGNRGLPYADASVDAVTSSFVLSYLAHPEDAIAESWRVLRPGGVFVASSMIPDSDNSRMYLELVKRLEQLPASQLPPGTVDPATARTDLANAARRFGEHAAELFRLEEEGLFRFYQAEALAALVARRGFVDLEIDRAFGDPPQAVVVTCRKP